MPSEISRSAPHAADILTLDDVSLGYGGKPVVEAVGGVIPRGALLALVGPNGAGKSTLLKALAGLHRPSTGKIDNGLTGERPVYMPQHTAIDHAFPMSVIDFVAMGLWREIGLWKPMSTPQRDRAHASLVNVGLGDTAHQRIGTLSGGQLRRVLFARVALQDAALILLDEPFAGVDASTSRDLMAMIAAWHAQGRTIVAALHDLAQVRAYFPQTLLLSRRVIAWGATAEVLAATQSAAVLGRDTNQAGRAHV